MDIKKQLLRGHSKVLTDKIVKYIGADQRRFNTLIDIFLKGTYQVTQRAAWSVSHCVRNHPSLIDQHYGTVLKILAKPGIHDAVKRNIMRLLQFVEVPKRYQGQVIEQGFRLMDPKEPVAVRVFAMTVLANLTRQHPDLKNELKLTIEDQLPFGTAAYLSRSKKILRQLEK
jgi:hypothetical protein